MIEGALWFLGFIACIVVPFMLVLSVFVDADGVLRV